MMEEVDSVELPRDWVSVFSFLASVPSASGWCEAELWSTTPSERAEYLAQVAAAARARPNSTIGELYPLLPPRRSIDDLGLQNRARNALARRDYRTTTELLDLPVHEMLDWSGVGTQTIDNVLEALAGLVLRALEDPELHGVVTGRPSAVTPSAAVADLTWLSDVRADLKTIASWQASLGLQTNSLLSSTERRYLPPRVHEAQQRLFGLDAADVLAGGAAPVLATLIEEALEVVEDRGREILRRRLFAHTSTTLDELGSELGVTRERVRQIEKKSAVRLREAFSEDGLLLDASATVADAVGGLRPFQDLLREIPALTEVVPSLNEPVWRVLDVLDETYEIKDGWCASPSVASAQQETALLLAELADDHGAAPLDSIDVVATRHLDHRMVTYQWLSYCGYNFHESWVLTRTKSISDYAAGLLSSIGSPQTTESILALFDRDRSAGSVRNALSDDARFVRVDRDTWALVEWGLEGYTSIRDKIGEHLDRLGGSAPLSELVEAISSSFTVSPSSVIAYAAAPPFQTQKSVVSRTAAPVQGRPPQRTRNLYRRENTWLLRTTISNDHMRGSGSPAPSAITHILGIAFGEEKRLQSADGEQAVYWTGIQPGFGTIRRLLTAQGLEVGDEVFFVLGDDQTFAIERVPSADADDPLAAAAALAGRASAAEPLAALADAISLPAEADRPAIIAAYRARGESDIVDLLGD